MNEARDLYLKTYGAIDRMDHLIQNCNMKYRTWKYWHSGMIHGNALAVVVAYDFYLEACTGHLRPEWKVEKPVSFYRFREILGHQMLTYSPTNRQYPGDESLRVCTKQSVKRRIVSSMMSSDSSQAMSSLSSSSGTTTSNGINKEKLDMAGNRLCGFLDELLLHEKAVKPIPNKAHQVCHCCGKAAYHYCSRCPGNPALHAHHHDGKNTCFLHYHNTGSFGSWKEDFKWTGAKRKDWKMPDEAMLQESSRQMKRLHQSIVKPTSNRSSTLAEAVRNDPTRNEHTI